MSDLTKNLPVKTDEQLRAKLHQSFAAVMASDLDHNGRIEGKEESIAILQNSAAGNPELKSVSGAACDLAAYLSPAEQSAINQAFSNSGNTIRTNIELFRLSAHATPEEAAKAAGMAADRMVDNVAIPLSDENIKELKDYVKKDFTREIAIMQNDPELRAMAEKLPVIGDIPSPSLNDFCKATTGSGPARNL